METCNCPIDVKPIRPGAVSYSKPCGRLATKFFVATHDDTPNTFGAHHLYPRCDDHWATTALVSSPIVQEMTYDEFAVFRVMLS